VKVDQLSPRHETMLLEESAIKPEVAAERGYRTVEDPAELQELGFASYQCRVPALLVPLHGPHGELVLYQARPDAPRRGEDGKAIKYETPEGARMVLDVPELAREHIGNPRVPLLVTEGAKKEDALISAGARCVVGIVGVWNWRGRNGHDGLTALGEWESIALNGRDVYLLFDSDAKTNPGVRLALMRLGRFLQSRKARVWVMLPPEGEGEEKQGADDYLAAGGNLLELKAGAVPLSDFALRKIRVNNRHLRDVTDDALAALAERNEPPEVFVRSGALVRVREDENGVPQIQTMDDNHVRGRLARVADFVRVTEKGETKVNPPEVVVGDIKALEGWGLPALEAVVESPIVRPDGTIFDTPGYDPQTRLVYKPARGFKPPTIPADPTADDVRGAIELIDEAIGEFPYEDGASAANTLGLMLTPLVRQAIDGPVPMALIDKPQAGTGGSLLAETVAIIGTGREAEMLGAPRDDEEWRKQITAKLSSGATMITVDNVEHPLYAPSLARALTARTWTDRVLGRSESITLAQRATWLATGNNIILRGDLPRRCYWIRLDAKKARPWQRGGFKHPDLLRWVSENRAALVRALLIIARAWFAADKPPAAGVPRLGSFEAWAETVGGMVAFAGIPGFLGNLEALYEKADEGGAEWEEFLSAWWEACGEDPITVAQLVEKIEADDDLRAALPPDLAEVLDKGQGSFTRRLGKALSSRAGTRYGEDELHVVKAGEKKRALMWKAQKGSPEGEFTSLVSLYNPSASKNSGRNGGQRDKIRVGGPETNSQNSQTHCDPEAWTSDADEDLEGLEDLYEEDR
jgi:hypothetical protein